MKNIKPYRPTKQEWLEFRKKLKRIGDLPAEDKEDRIDKLREQAESIKKPIEEGG